MHYLVAQKLQDFKIKENKTVIVSEYYVTPWIKRQTFRIDALDDALGGLKSSRITQKPAYLSTRMEGGLAMIWWDAEGWPRLSLREAKRRSNLVFS
jgi:hypothetical protein